MANSDNTGILAGQTEIAVTKVPAANRYGQNGYQGPSSDLPGQHTRIEGFQKAVTVPKDDGGWQTRQVDAKPYAPSHGMRDRNAAPTIIQGHISHTRNKATS